jgi:hypothetical protein
VRGIAFDYEDERGVPIALSFHVCHLLLGSLELPGEHAQFLEQLGSLAHLLLVHEDRRLDLARAELDKVDDQLCDARVCMRE